MSTVKLNRRSLLKMMGLGAAATLIPSKGFSAALHRVVVVGGGFAGATAAKYLKLWGGASIEVVLINKEANYASPILSNLVINDQKTMPDLTFSYNSLANNYGITVMTGEVTDLDFLAKTLLVDGISVSFDRIVLAPGIDFKPVPGLDFNLIPHAWQAGEQTELLKAQVDQMTDGDHFAMVIPRSPYRCPPGPYERACVIADYLKNQKGFSNCRVSVFDHNADITVEAETFHAQFTRHGIDYTPNITLNSVDSTQRIMTFTLDNSEQSLQATVLNVIPNQQAAPIIFDNALNDGDWAAVNPMTFESTKQPGVYVIGDSQGTGVPKAGHIANSEAKVCASALLSELNGLSPHTTVKINSACYSPVSINEATWLTVVYEYNSATQQLQPVAGANYPAMGLPSTSNYRDMFNWSGNLFSDTFA